MGIPPQERAEWGWHIVGPWGSPRDRRHSLRISKIPESIPNWCLVDNAVARVRIVSQIVIGSTGMGVPIATIHLTQSLLLSKKENNYSHFSRDLCDKE
jgi:hypothetical protein